MSNSKLARLLLVIAAIFAVTPAFAQAINALSASQPASILQRSALVGMFSGFTESLVPSWQNNVNRTAQILVSNLDDSSRAAFDSGCVSQTNNYNSETRPIVWGFPMNTSGETLASIAAGDHDASITACAQQIFNVRAKYEQQIIIRIGWEMTLPGAFPWYSGGGLQPTYVAAFQRMVGLIRAVSTRFVFDWCPNWAQDDPEPSYPGDAYVDIIGMDAYYDIAFDDPDPVAAWDYKVNAPFGLQWQVDFAATHGKRLSMPEWGINSNNKQAYVALQAQWFIDKNYLYQAYWWSNQAFSGILTAYPATNAGYQAAFGPPIIQNADLTISATTPGSIGLSANASPVTWTLSGPSAGSFSLAGSTLSYGSLAAGTYIIRVTAQNELGLISSRVLRIAATSITPATCTFLWNQAINTSGTSWSSASHALGNGNTTVTLGFRAVGAATTFNTVTIGGVAAVQNSVRYNTSDGNTSASAIYTAATSGGTGIVTVTSTGTAARMTIGAFEVTGVPSTTAFDATSAVAAADGTLASTINTAASGVLVAGSYYTTSAASGSQLYSGGCSSTSAATGSAIQMTNSGTTATWTGVTKAYDASVSTGSFAPEAMTAASFSPI